jgi:phosphotransferase system enzyme I (PtsP)
MFPFITEHAEFMAARSHVLHQLDREVALGVPAPDVLEIGAMVETPSAAYAPRAFFETADFLSVGGNDIKQFFFAADRENERVRRRYDVLNLSFLMFLQSIAARCAEVGTPLSFCGEDAGKPVEAVCLAAMGFPTLSMRPASVGPVKALLRRVDLRDLRAVIEGVRAEGGETARPAVMAYLAGLGE